MCTFRASRSARRLAPRSAHAFPAVLLGVDSGQEGQEGSGKSPMSALRGHGELDRAQRDDQRERAVQGYARLSNDPRVLTAMRPGRGVDEERMAKEHVP